MRGFTDLIDMLPVQSERQRNAFPTVSRLSRNDVVSMWANVSAYIERQMTLQKGVHVAGLGTFSFSQQKLEVGNKVTVIQRPVFLLDKKLTHSHGLKQTRPLAAAAHVPAVQLNYAALAVEALCARGEVERCVKETLLVLLRAAASGRSVSLTLQGVGVLCFQQRQVKMKFTTDFLNAMDGTGRLHLAFSHRPGTSGSQVSGAPGGVSGPQRPQAPGIDLSSITLAGACSLPPLDPDRTGKDPRGKRAYTSLPLGPDRSFQNSPVQTPPPGDTVRGVRLPEDHPIPPLETTDRSTVAILPPEGAVGVEESDGNHCCIGHNRAGQELCYLCFQRAERNHPIYLREERQAEERAQGRHLLEGQLQKDRLHLQREQGVLRQAREEAQRVAAFNLGAAAVRDDRAHRPEFHSSFLLSARPLTPPRGPEQQVYGDELRAQVAQKRQRNGRLRQGQHLLECLEQVQLHRAVTSQKSQELQQKQEEAKHYRRALDIQVEEKKDQGLPRHEPNHAAFCRAESPSATVESKERAQKILWEHLDTVARKKREESSSRQSQREKEAEMLARDRKRLIAERVDRFERTRDLRASLEDTWRRSADLKSRRDAEEKRFLRAGGHLLLCQCEQYSRCLQCQKRTSNRGESNVLKASRLHPPSHLMT